MWHIQEVGKNSETILNRVAGSDAALKYNRSCFYKVCPIELFSLK